MKRPAEVNITDLNYVGEIWILSQHQGEDGFVDIGFFASFEDAEITRGLLLETLHFTEQTWLRNMSIRQVVDVPGFLVQVLADYDDCDKYSQPEPCQAFLLCVRDAVTMIDHPILGSVPCCAKCAAKLSN